MRMARLPSGEVEQGGIPERQTMVSALSMRRPIPRRWIGPNRYVAIDLWLGARSSCDEQCRFVIGLHPRHECLFHQSAVGLRSADHADLLPRPGRRIQRKPGEDANAPSVWQGVFEREGSTSRASSSSGTHTARNFLACCWTNSLAGPSRPFGTGNCNWWDMSTPALRGGARRSSCRLRCG